MPPWKMEIIISLTSNGPPNLTPNPFGIPQPCQHSHDLLLLPASLPPSTSQPAAGFLHILQDPDHCHHLSIVFSNIHPLPAAATSDNKWHPLSNCHSVAYFPYGIFYGCLYLLPLEILKGNSF
jgi:hypothetical protein